MIRLKDLLTEGYNMTKLGADLESWAKKNGLNFKKVSSEKKPGPYGSSISNTFYQIGDKYALVRYETVTGAPRLNQLRFAIFDKPDLASKATSVQNYVDDFGYVEQALEKAGLKGGKEVTKWTKGTVDKLVKDLGKDKKYNKFTDAQAGDMAQSVLDDNEGLEQAIKSIYRVRDAAGWLADKM
jgi:hypothetical protein